MAEYIESLQRLAEQFGRLEGIGKKNAMKMAFSVLDMTDEEAEEFARAILDAKHTSLSHMPEYNRQGYLSHLRRCSKG